MEEQEKKDECCPKFNPTLWEDKEFTWENKKFIKDKVFTFFFMPVGFGKTIRRMNTLMDKAGAKSEEWMSLSDHTTKWNMDLYISVDREVPGATNVTLSGKFFSKVYEGNFNKTGEWCKDFEARAKEKNLSVKKWYMWYTTCPKCAKKYGKNYVVVVGQVD